MWLYCFRRIAYWLWIAHFVKRELETVFVHRFSRPTMPLLNLFKNSIYYWSFAALVSHPLCSPYYMAASPDRMTLGAIIFLIAELVNGAVHIQLRLMRPAVRH